MARTLGCKLGVTLNLLAVGRAVPWDNPDGTARQAGGAQSVVAQGTGCVGAAPGWSMLCFQGLGSPSTRTHSVSECVMVWGTLQELLLRAGAPNGSASAQSCVDAALDTGVPIRDKGSAGGLLPGSDLSSSKRPEGSPR